MLALPKYGVDEWKTGYFDITLGDFRINFVTGDLLTAAIDDIKMLPGLCSEVCKYARAESTNSFRVTELYFNLKISFFYC